MTAFHHVGSFGFKEMTKLILNFTKENGRIDLNARDENGETAFQVACIWGNKETADLIIENWKEFDIDLKIRNIAGHTALDMLHENNMDGRPELKAMLEEEYSKIDASEPVDT